MRLRTVVCGVLASLVLATALAAPASATTLAPNPDLAAQGLGLSIAEGGVGLEGIGSGTRSFTVNIGGSVQKAFLYWSGVELAGCDLGACFEPPNTAPFGDQQLLFNTTAITGTVVGKEPQSQGNIAYRADVTSIVSALGTGLKTFTIQDGNTANNLDRLDGAGLIVLYNNPADPAFYRVIVYEGLDFVSSSVNPFPANSVTDPVNFTYTPVAASRTGQLVIFSADGEAARPDRIGVSNNASLLNQLDGSDGPQWDTDSFNITIPAGVGTTTVQLFSEPANQNPDSLLWVLGALRIPIPQTTGGQGCTPGFWKSHPEAWPPTGFTVGQTVSSVFTVPGSLSSLGSATLFQALSFPGGSGVLGSAQILLRAAVAGLLNAGHPNVNYPQTASQIISSVNTALASNNRTTMINLAAQLDTFNNAGCTP